MRVLKFITSVAAAVALFCAAAYMLGLNLPPPYDRLTGRPRDIAEIRQRITPEIKASLAEKGLHLGNPVFMRIFKEERVLELWVKAGQNFQLYKSYRICSYSGELGPKLREGDYQSPEGFYTVGKPALNPNSSYHLSFNLGFPNPYDRAHNRTGSFLMVHGNCVSIGCYAMTNAAIEEIYVLAEAALDAGQPFFRVHAFPFRMTDARLAAESDSPWFGFWQNLKAGYDVFEQFAVPPSVTVSKGEYVFARS